MNTEDLWKKFKKDGDEKARDELLKAYVPIVKYFTDRIAWQLPAEVRGNDKEDLYIEGIMGLLEAMERFDPLKNIKFETFASKRVRGAIIDALRKEDPLPKHIREAARKVERAFAEIEGEKGRPATDAEVAAKLGMTEEALYDILEKMKGVSLYSLEGEFLNRDGDSFTFEDLLGTGSEILEKYEQNEAVTIMAGLLDRLSREERIIVECYYWDGLTFREIGKVLGISESRVCQMHTKIVLRLRSGFRKTDK